MIAPRFLYLFSIAALCLAVAQTALAGEAPSPARTLTFKISDERGNLLEQQDVTGLLSEYNASTGALSTKATGSLSSYAGWSWSTVDITTGQTMAKSLTWKSTTTVDGIIPESTVQLKAAGNVDPFMSYSFAAKNNTGSIQHYSFSYGESIFPTLAGDYAVSSGLGISLTHGASLAGAQLSPAVSSAIQALSLSANGPGGPFTNAGVDLGTAPFVYTGTSPRTHTFPTLIDQNTGNIGLIDYWQFDIGFDLTAGGDAVGMTGSADIVAIPEPSTYAALLGGVTLLGVAFVRRRTAAV